LRAASDPVLSISRQQGHQDSALSPSESGPFDAQTCNQTFSLSELPCGLSSPANCLAFLPRSSLGRLFIGFPSLQFMEKAFALELLFQDSEGLIDVGMEIDQLDEEDHLWECIRW
jgi:hypothetical protein